MAKASKAQVCTQSRKAFLDVMEMAKSRFLMDEFIDRSEAMPRFWEAFSITSYSMFKP